MPVFPAAFFSPYHATMRGQEYHVTVDGRDESPVALMHAASGLSKQRIKHAMQCGAVWLTRGKRTQRLRRASRQLRPGDEIHLYYDAKILAERPTPATLVHDGGEFSVWNKPRGMRSQGSRWGDHCTITRWAETQLTPQRNAFTVHRLDRASAGLIVVAHARRVAANLSAQFRERRVDKRYRAVVAGDLSSVALPHRIDEPIDGKSACSTIETVMFDAATNQSTLDIVIETGRKHQIRRHLAGIDHPIVGDRLHGTTSPDDIDLQLTAIVLAFDDPRAAEDEPQRLAFELRAD